MLFENFDAHLITGDPESPTQALSLLNVFSTQEISLVNPCGNFEFISDNLAVVNFINVKRTNFSYEHHFLRTCM